MPPLRVIVDGLAAEPSVSVPPTRLLVNVRFPLVNMLPVNARLCAPLGSRVASAVSQNMPCDIGVPADPMSFAIVISAPMGCTLGGNVPLTKIGPVPKGPEVTAPGEPTLLAPIRMKPCAVKGPIVVPPEKMF